jgi:hypothetical protein
VNFLTIFLEKFIDQILKARNKLAKFFTPEAFDFKQHHAVILAL